MKKEINQHLKLNPKCNEVDLFRFISTYLSKNYKTTFIEESHQCYVEFMPQKPKCDMTRKEISDLWIIAYSIKNKKAKMTFLQAKYERIKRKVKKPFKFSADYFQYNLLKNRPQIKNLCKLNFPENILSNAKYDSIGTYGIFYYDNNNKLNFSFSVASDLTFKRKANCNAKTRTLIFADFEYYVVHREKDNFDLDLRNTLEADVFEYSLIKLMIGSPFEDDIELLAFLKRKFKDINDAKDFYSFLDLFDSQSQSEKYNAHIDNSSIVTPNILLINIDGEK